MRSVVIPILLSAILTGCAFGFGGDDNFIATVGKPTEQRIAVAGEEIASVYNEKGDKIATYIFQGMTGNRRVLIHKKTGRSAGIFGKRKDATEKVILTLHETLRFANGSRIICLDVDAGRLTYRRISM